MHDCRKTKEALIDLVFDEMEAEAGLSLLKELEACRECRAEHRLMRQALSDFDEAAPALLPTGEFWAEHHARIEERLSSVTSVRATPARFWRRAFQTSFSIPAPAAIAAALLLAATSVLAVRSFISEPKPASGVASTSMAASQVQYVEVPVEKRVVEERVVTRTVYVNKRARNSNQTIPSLQDLPGMTAQKSRGESVNPTRETLNGFLPPADVKLTVIKGSFNDEK